MTRIIFNLLLTLTLLPLVWLSACRDTQPVAPAPAANVLEGSGFAAPANALEATYLANEGFMIAGGGRKLLIDALFREGVSGAPLSGTARASAEAVKDLSYCI